MNAFNPIVTALKEISLKLNPLEQIAEGVRTLVERQTPGAKTFRETGEAVAAPVDNEYAILETIPKDQNPWFSINTSNDDQSNKSYNHVRGTIDGINYSISLENPSHPSMTIVNYRTDKVETLRTQNTTLYFPENKTRIPKPAEILTILTGIKKYIKSTIENDFHTQEGMTSVLEAIPIAYRKILSRNGELNNLKEFNKLYDELESAQSE
jgi:hypothetical protein